MLFVGDLRSSVSQVVVLGWVLAASILSASADSLEQSSDWLGVSQHERDRTTVEPGADLLLRAHLLRESDEHGLAVAVLREALQAVRAARGLYHADQLEILNLLIASEIARENWRQVDDLHALLLHLVENLYANDAEKLEPVLVQATRWHVDALRYALDGRPVPHLRQTRELLKARLRLAESAETRDARKIERLQEGIHAAEKHLIMQSDSHMDDLRKRQMLQRAWLLSSLD